MYIRLCWHYRWHKSMMFLTVNHQQKTKLLLLQKQVFEFMIGPLRGGQTLNFTVKPNLKLKWPIHDHSNRAQNEPSHTTLTWLNSAEPIRHRFNQTKLSNCSRTYLCRLTTSDGPSPKFSNFNTAFILVVSISVLKNFHR